MATLYERMITAVRKASWAGYAIYALVLTAGLLAYRFPSDVIKGYLASQAAAARPPMTLSMKEVRPDLPPGIELTDVALSLKDNPDQEVLRADTISIAPALWTFISGGPRYDIRAKAYRGVVTGHVRLLKKGTQNAFGTTLSISSLQIGLHSWIRSLLGREAAGTLSGDIRYVGPQGRFIEGEGEGTVVISDGKLKLRQPILGMSTLDFDRLSAAASLKDRRVALTQVRLEGKTLKGELSGTVLLSPNLQKSRLDLKGTIEPLGGLVEQMKGNAAVAGLVMQGLKKLGRSFVIQGTIENPVFRFT